MTYPYGTKGAPVVGNGLGGLPRRPVASAAATVAAGAIVMQPVGSVINTATYTSQGIGFTWGCLVGESGGKAVFPFSNIDGGGNTNYFIGGVEYSSSGVISALNPHTFSTTLDPWRDFRQSSTWVSGSSTFFYAFRTNNIHQISAPGSSVVFSTPKTTAIPATGTLTVGGASYTLISSNQERVIGVNSTSINDLGGSIVQKLPGDQILILRYATISSIVRLAGFVLDSAFNIVRSFEIATTNFGSSDRRSTLLLPVKNSTELFSVFLIAGDGSGSAMSALATFNTTTGSVIASAFAAAQFSAASSLVDSTYLIEGNRLSVFYPDYGTTAQTWVVRYAIDSNFSVLTTPSPSTSQFSSVRITIPALRYYDPIHDDYFSHSRNNSSPLEPLLFSNGTGNFAGIAPVRQTANSFTYTNPASTFTATATVPSLSAFAFIENDQSNNAFNPPGAGPWPMVRIGRNSFIAGFEDSSSSSQRRINTQLFTGTS